MALGFVIAVCGGSSTVTAQPIQPQRGLPPGIRARALQQQRGSPSKSRRIQSPSVLIEPSAPIANLFHRAEDGIQRGDWKFAIDSLQRIIEDPGESLIARDVDPGPTFNDHTMEGSEASERPSFALYETARRVAIRRLAALPPEGRHAYRLLFDGKAKRLFEIGKTQGDSGALRTVVTRYLLTAYGDDATDLLASRALDAGRPGEAVALLTDLRELVSEHDTPQLLITTKLAVAFAMLGRQDLSASTLEAGRSRVDENAKIEMDQWTASVTSLATSRRGAPAGRDDVPSWPRFGGSLDRTANMPVVDPTLIDDVPWRFALPGTGGDSWRLVFGDDPAGPLWLPAAQAVTDRERVFLRTETGCVALHTEDLSLAWETHEPDREPRVVRDSFNTGPTVRGAVQQPAISDPFRFEDYVVGGIAQEQGLVLTVSRQGHAEYVRNDRFSHDGRIAPPPPPGAMDPTPTPNRRSPPVGSRIVAYDALTGEIRWQRGRTGHPADPLAQAQFRSVPLSAEGALWVPYYARRDFRVALLDAEDGRLIHSLLLCSITGPEPDRWTSLSPTYADGVVYVPSGQGVLFAIDAMDLTVRWAAQYAFLPGHRYHHRPPGSHGWLPTPPMVSGGFVLLTSAEHPELLALSSVSGEPQWSRPIGDSSYVIAADHESVWLGGRSVVRLALSDGTEVWNTPIPATPTGRAVLSGKTETGLSRILVPVLDGLVSLDATTGEGLAYDPAPASEEPLGNLLCLDTAMFVVNASGIRKYPDLERSYGRAIARYNADPTTPVATTRLAWLELLTDRPKRAFDLLQTVADTALADRPQLADQIAHLTVESLLALSKKTLENQSSAEPDESHAETIALLEEARRASRKRSDRLRCELAISDQLSAMGRHDDAYDRLWKLGVSSDAAQPVKLGEQVEGAVRYDIARRLQRLTAKLTQEQNSRMRAARDNDVAAASSQLGDASAAQQGRTRLLAMSQLASTTTIGQRALSTLGKHYDAKGRHELAEQYLRGAVRSEADESLTLEALAELCRLYKTGISVGAESNGLLIECLNSLETRFGSAPLPESLIADMKMRTPLSVSVDRWVERQRRRIKTATQQAFQTSYTGAAAHLVTRPAWSMPLTTVNREKLVRFVNGQPLALAERVLVYRPDNVVTCFNAHDGDVVWEAALRLPESFSSLGSINAVRRNQSPRPYAVADGQIGVFNTDDALFAVGLATGRRLWMRPFERAGETRPPVHRGLTMAAMDGFLAAMPKAGRLTLMNIGDGATVWEHDMRDEPVDRIWMFRDREDTRAVVVTADFPRERVSMIERETGRLIRRIQFQQPETQEENHATVGRLAIVGTSGVLCGPISNSESDAIVGVDVATGEHVWRVELDKPPVQLFSPQKGFVAVGLFGGDVRMIDVATGDVMTNRQTENTWWMSRTHKVVGGRLIDGTLLVQHVASREEVKNPKLGAIDIVTGEELWQRHDVVSLARSDGLLQVMGGSVPALVLPPRDAKRPQTDARSLRKTAPSRNRSVVMIDVRTGLNVGEPALLKTTRGGDSKPVDVMILPVAKVVVFETKASIRVLPLELTEARLLGATESDEGT